MKHKLETAGNKTQLKNYEQTFGMNYDPHGLLWDDYLFTTVLDIPRCYLRDPMHTMMSKGVCGTEIILIIRKLNSLNIKIEAVQAYAAMWKLPKSRGKVNDLYFKTTMLDSDNVRHFASDVLVMVMLLYSFLIDKVAKLNVMPLEIACFSKLYDIVCLIKRGAACVAELRKAVLDHANMFKHCWGDGSIVPKFHHLLHIPDEIEWLARMIWCFVTERKHQDIKQVARSACNQVEHAVLHDFLNSTVQNYIARGYNFVPKYMEKPQHVTVSASLAMWVSTSIVMECGTVSQFDVIYLRDNTVAEALEFWQSPGNESIAAKVRFFKYVKIDDMDLWRVCNDIRFIDIELIAEPVCWCVPYKGHIRITPPPSMGYRYQ